MTEQQRKAIEILNSLREPMILSEERALSEDDYFYLLSFIIDKPHDLYIPTPCPNITPWPSQNAIIINGTTYELVPNDTGKDVCESCALNSMCKSLSYSLCVDFHDADTEYHYIKQQKECQS